MAEANETQEKVNIKKESVSLQDIYDVYAKQAKEDITQEKEISLIDKFNVEFTANYGLHLKGSKLKGISKVAFDLYNANGVIKIDKSK